VSSEIGRVLEPATAAAVDGDDTPVTAAQRGYAVLMIILASTPLVVAYFADKWAEKHLTQPWIIGAALAIGGVTPADVPVILRAGGSGVAVVSGILGAEDVEAAARRYTEAGKRVSG